jgi:hypothetical protein
MLSYTHGSIAGNGQARKMVGEQIHECPICGTRESEFGESAYCPRCGLRSGAPSHAVVFADQGVGMLAHAKVDRLALAYVRGIELCGAFLAGMDLFHANLAAADLHGADLGGANLNNADLRGADLRGTNLSETDLSDADLRGADLTDAQLRGADLHGALYNSDTHWPMDVDPRVAGAVADGET